MEASLEELKNNTRFVTVDQQDVARMIAHHLSSSSESLHLHTSMQLCSHVYDCKECFRRALASLDRFHFESNSLTEINDDASSVTLSDTTAQDDGNRV